MPQLHTPALDQPRRPLRVALPRPQPDWIGRAAEATARLIGTGRFLAAQTVVLMAWLVVNVPGSPVRFDLAGYPLLTLILSLQAAYAAPLILLAQNRQDDRDRAVVATERASADGLRATVDYLARELATLRAAHAATVTRGYLDEALDRQLTSVRELLPVR